MAARVAVEPHRTPSSERSRWLPEIDGMRAVACLAVVFAHYTPWVTVGQVVNLGVLAPAWAGLLAIPIGSLGVQLFFAISSFLLTYLAVRERLETGSFSPLRFLVRRTLRIWPLYYTVFLAHIAFAFLAKPHFPSPETMADPLGWLVSTAWVYPLFVQNWIDSSLPEIGILWSLGVEEQFYLLFPWVMLAVFARRVAPSHSLVGLLTLNAVAVLAFLAGFKLAANGMYYATTTYLGTFAAGAWAGWIVGHDGDAWRRVGGLLRRHRLAFGVGLLVILCVVGYRPHSRIHSPSWLSLPTFWALAVCYAGMILWVLANRESSLSRWLRSRTMRELGFLSFGVYMWHIISKSLVFWRFQAVDMAQLGPDLTFALTFAYYAAGAVAAATVTYVAVERPVLRYKARYSGHGEDRPGAPDHRLWPWYLFWPAVVVLMIEAVLLAR